MVFANISIEGWVIDPYEQSLFNCPGKVLVLPSNYAEVFDVSFMTWDVTVVMNGRGGLLMFFEPFCKGPKVLASPMAQTLVQLYKWQ